LYKNTLIPTDGSDLATKAVEQGVQFAKEIGAKITAVTVTEPYHLLSVAPSQLEYTPIEYKKHAEAHTEKVLGTVAAAAKLAGVDCETLHVEHEHVYQAIIMPVILFTANMVAANPDAVPKNIRRDTPALSA
jgi:nucleotide-binding universal stress UspA family protein